MYGNKLKVFVVVARHGERWDYLQQDAGKGKEWIERADRPWDPPLSPNGLRQATRLGEHLVDKLHELGLPPITAVYTSPFLRCRQTACQATEAINNSKSVNQQQLRPTLKVKVEVGLTESLNESWYRSWALLGLSDTTWGFSPKRFPRRELDEYDTTELHPSSQVPAHQILNWKDVWTHSIDNGGNDSNELLRKLQDFDYQSTTTINKDFALKPHVLVESKKEQQDRMHQVILNQTMSWLQARDGQPVTLLMISHGGPVTHLYEKMTGKNWHCHGESKYCCYSIYEGEARNQKEEDLNRKTCWKTLVVNESNYLSDLWSESSANI